MRTSQYLLSTIKEVPSNTETVSYQLMLRSGMIRKLASGLYIWLPTGLRVLRKIEKVVRQEMNKTGAIEISMPLMQPAELWRESGRWIQYGSELLHFLDRDARPFILGPTHEEIITNLIRNEISSYKQLPLNFYQIQTKFRDEMRPRFGTMRSREFVMKDAYSFHSSQASLKSTYSLMYQTYNTIFTRIGLEFRAVQADTGSIGGIISHEFQALSDNGEDDIAFSTESDYAANIELVEAIAPIVVCDNTKSDTVMHLIETLNSYICSGLAKNFLLLTEKSIKISIVHAHKSAGYPLVALIIRDDHQLNNVKVEKLPQVAKPLKFASEEEIQLTIGTNPSGFLWLKNLPLVVDRSVALMNNFTINAINKQYFFERALPLPQIADLRKVVDGDISPDGKGVLQIKRGIEIGHIFQLGKKYSTAMKATVQGKDGRNQIVIMGCYGIGITRIAAAAIEQNHDEHGILWPEILAPFNVAILPMYMNKSFRIKEVAEMIYRQLQTHGIDVLLDDRKERPGVMFADIELIGIPHILVISDHNLEIEKIEYKNRRSGEKQLIKLNQIIDFLLNKIIVTQ